MKKVISFCIYGNSSKYCLGAIENAQDIREKYPDWIVYMYYNNVPTGILDVLKEYGCKLIPYDSKNSPCIGMFYRFLPLHDETVDLWISRDCDSRISQREMDLVEQWIQSGKMFHVIRDHPYHGITILGGTFGINNRVFNSQHSIKMDDFIEKYYEQSKGLLKGPDQKFLVRDMWPLIKDDHMAHISCSNVRFHEDDIFIQPVSRHVGRDIAANDETIIKYGGLLKNTT